MLTVTCAEVAFEPSEPTFHVVSRSPVNISMTYWGFKLWAVHHLPAGLNLQCQVGRCAVSKLPCVLKQGMYLLRGESSAPPLPGQRVV